MNTTSIFVEILIIGPQTGIWLIALGVGLGGADWPIYTHTKYSSLLPFITLPAFATIYTLDIALDRISDVLFLFFFPKWIRRCANVIFQSKSQRHSREHVFALISEGKGSSFFEYIRSRMRIVRVATLNTVISISCISFAYLKNCRAPACFSNIWGIILFLLLAVFVLIALLVAYSLLDHAYDPRMSQAGLVINHHLPNISTEP